MISREPAQECVVRGALSNYSRGYWYIRLNESSQVVRYVFRLGDQLLQINVLAQLYIKLYASFNSFGVASLRFISLIGVNKLETSIFKIPESDSEQTGYLFSHLFLP